MAPPRFQARTPVRAALWTHEITEDAVEFQGMSLNISSGGMRIEARRFLLAGAKLDVRFRLPGQSEELYIVSQVVWSARAEDGFYQSGLQFLVMRERARSRIGEYIAAAVSDRAGTSRPRPRRRRKPATKPWTGSGSCASAKGARWRSSTPRATPS